MQNKLGFVFGLFFFSNYCKKSSHADVGSAALNVFYSHLLNLSGHLFLTSCGRQIKIKHTQVPATSNHWKKSVVLSCFGFRFLGVFFGITAKLFWWTHLFFFFVSKAPFTVKRRTQKCCVVCCYVWDLFRCKWTDLESTVKAELNEEKLLNERGVIVFVFNILLLIKF